MWLRDRPVRWIDELLQVAAGYRTLRGTLSGDDAGRAGARAAEVAAIVRAREPRAEREPEPNVADAQRLPESTAFNPAMRALDRIEQLALGRDSDVVEGAAVTRRIFARASVRSVLVWRSQILRHALRTVIGVVLTFFVAWATVGPRNPLVTTMTTAAFAILQISWSQTLFKARQRLVDIAGRAAVMALALWLLPHAWLLPFALLAALSGLWLIATNQVLSIGNFAVVSVGMNVVSRGLDPTRTLVEYVLLLLAGVTIGLLCGFVVVPHLQPDRVDQRVQSTRDTVAQLLWCVARLAPPADGEPRRAMDLDILVRPLYELRTAVVNLSAPLHRTDEQAGVRNDDCRSLATKFETLAIVGVIEAAEGRLTAPTLTAAADVLVAPLGSAEQLGSPDFIRFAAWVRAGSEEFRAAAVQSVDGSEITG